MAAATTMPSIANAMMSCDLAVVIDKGGQALRVFNFGNQAISNADLWINSTYTFHIDSIRRRATRSLT